MYTNYSSWSPAKKRRYIKECQDYWLVQAITEPIRSIDTSDDVWG